MDLCCEIVKRLREDINRIFFDSKVYTSIESVYEQKVLKYDRILNEFNSKSTCGAKIASHSSRSHNEQLDCFHKAMEFSQFIKLTWMSLENQLEGKCKKIQFMSCNGLALGLYLTKLSDFITLVEKNYIGLFTHPGCVATYNILEKQIKTSLSSMLPSCDELEAMIAYVDSAVPLLTHLIGTIESYTASPMLDFYEFYLHQYCREEETEPLPEEEITQTLSLYCIFDLIRDDCENLTPVVSSRSHEHFMETATQLATTILELEFTDRRPISEVGTTGITNGCLDPNFLDTLHTLPLNHLSYELPHMRRSRGRPRKPNFSLPRYDSSFKYTNRFSSDPLSINDLEK